jgi:hypothetical protein
MVDRGSALNPLTRLPSYSSNMHISLAGNSSDPIHGESLPTMAHANRTSIFHFYNYLC